MNTTKAEAIGKRIKELRKSLGLSAEEVAADMGISPATVYRYESAAISNMGIDKLESLANILYTTPDYLLGLSDDPHDWERIGNDEGIYPPSDFSGDYSEYVKYKLTDETDHLIDDYYDTYQSAASYLEKQGCKIIAHDNSNLIVLSPDNELLEVSEPTLVTNFKTFGKFNPGYKKLLTDFADNRFDISISEYKNIQKYRTLDEYGKKNVDTVLDNEYARCNESKTIPLKETTDPYKIHTLAAHARPDATEEEKQKDYDMMNDPSIWGDKA